MSTDSSYFEALHHQGFDGAFYSAPLYLDPRRNVHPELTVTLLQAADIVHAVVGRVGIAALLDDVGGMLSHPESTDGGVILEDESGGGSVTVDPRLMAVTKPNSGRRVAPTSLFFDMLYQMVQYDQLDEHRKAS